MEDGKGIHREKRLGDGPELPEKESRRSRVGSIDTGETRRGVLRVAGAAAAGAAAIAGGGIGLGAHAGSVLPGPGVAAAATGASEAVRAGMATGLDTLSDEAKHVLALATEEAQRFRHNYIGTEHLLLGLVRAGAPSVSNTSSAPNVPNAPTVAGDTGPVDATGTSLPGSAATAGVLGRLGVEVEQVRQAVEYVIGRGDRVVIRDITLTPRSKRVLDLALGEAQRLGHEQVGADHLLLGLVREGEGIAAGVLDSLGVSLEQVRQGVLGTGAGGAGLAASPAAVPWTLRPGAGRAVPGRSRQSTSVRFARFAEQTKQVLVRAHEEAQRLDHAYLGTEHLLLGLLRVEGGGASAVLAELPISMETARSAVVRLAGRGDRAVTGSISSTPRVTRVLHTSVEEADRMHHSSVGTEHLLLALLREGDGVAVQILKERGAGVEEIRQRVLLTISSQPNAERDSAKGTSDPAPWHQTSTTR